jgi:anaerobic magnesium-protoporphyrin IX monomethyl ester cyclase
VLPHVSFILGLPGETQASLHETVAFGEQLKQMGVQHGFHLLAPFPGTAAREENDQYDLKILSNDWSQYHANRAICETAAVTRQELDDIVIQWEEDFNKWLGWIEDRMTRGEAEAHEAWQLENLKRIVLIYDLMMKETIETKGYMAGNGENLQPAAALRELAARAAPDVRPQDVDQVYQTLKYAFDKGRLTFDQQEEGRQWQWVDYLP